MQSGWKTAPVTLAFLCSATPAPAGEVVAAEAYFDNPDIVAGDGQALPLSSDGAIGWVAAELPLSLLGPGAHVVYLRTQDDAGNWSDPMAQTFTLGAPPPEDLVEGATNGIRDAEAYIDDDPGPGLATPVAPGAATPDSVLEVASSALDLSGLDEGVHRVYFRSRDAFGNWSESIGQTFTVVRDPLGNHRIQAAELFLDEDPGVGLSLAFGPRDGAFDGPLELGSTILDLAGRTSGLHVIGCRTLDASGTWSPTMRQTLEYLEATGGGGGAGGQGGAGTGEPAGASGVGTSDSGGDPPAGGAEATGGSAGMVADAGTPSVAGGGSSGVVAGSPSRAGGPSFGGGSMGTGGSFDNESGALPDTGGVSSGAAGAATAEAGATSASGGSSADEGGAAAAGALANGSGSSSGGTGAPSDTGGAGAPLNAGGASAHPGGASAERAGYSANEGGKSSVDGTSSAQVSGSPSAGGDEFAASEAGAMDGMTGGRTGAAGDMAGSGSAAAASGDERGCGCRIARQTQSSVSWIGLLSLVALRTRRRRMGPTR